MSESTMSELVVLFPSLPQELRECIYGFIFVGCESVWRQGKKTEHSTNTRILLASKGTFLSALPTYHRTTLAKSCPKFVRNSTLLQDRLRNGQITLYFHNNTRDLGLTLWAILRYGKLTEKITQKAQDIIAEMRDGVSHPSDYIPALCEGARRGWKPIIEKLLEIPQIPIDEAPKTLQRDVIRDLGWWDFLFTGNALSQASSQGHTEVIESLLKHGANPNTGTSCSTTPLACAMSCGKSDGVKMLLEYGTPYISQIRRLR
jgi:hypothetical protein